MERLDKNLLIETALDLDNASLVKLCQTSKKINNVICENNNFWMRKLFRDFPNLIGKIPLNNNYRRIYKSLINNDLFSYYVFKSDCDNDQPPIFWDYIKKFPYFDDTGFDEKDYKIAENFPNFKERCGDMFTFEIYGNYPPGTKIWLAYSTFEEINLDEAFLSKEDTINTVLKTVRDLIKYAYTERALIENYHGQTLEELYDNKTEDEMINDFRNQLNEKGFFKLYDPVEDKYDWFLIKEFTEK